MDLTTQAFLHSIEPFPLFDEDEFNGIINLCQVISISRNEKIFEAGKEWDGLYFILEGRVKLVQEKSGRNPVVIDFLRTSNSFGGKSLLSEIIAQFSVYAVTSTVKLLFLSKKRFQVFLERHHVLEEAVKEYENREAIKKTSSKKLLNFFIMYNLNF